MKRAKPWRKTRAHHEVGDDGDEQEQRDAELVVLGDVQAVVQRLDPLATHDAPHQQERVVEVGEVPAGDFPVVEQPSALLVLHAVPLLACAPRGGRARLNF